MKKWNLLLFLALLGIFSHQLRAQDVQEKQVVLEKNELFQRKDSLSIRLKFSTKKIKADTNDSTYVASMFYYRLANTPWDSLKIKIRARGHFRKKNCYYVPLKLKLGKSRVKGRIFEGNSKLKVVSPCMREQDKNDYLIKEYMAYKLFELMSPYHLKTRLVTFEFVEEKGARTKTHKLKAILIEDMDNLANRHQGREMKRKVHPLHQDDLASLQNAFFQYLIGNTDFSNKGLHNAKLLYAKNKFIPVPYDFDMSGLVNASYATISGMQNIRGSIASVTERVYKGYERGDAVLQEVREDYIAHKAEIYAVVDGLEKEFNNPHRFEEARTYVADFFEVMEDEKKFQRRVVKRTRTKL